MQKKFVQSWSPSGSETWDRLQDTEAAHAAQSKIEAIQEAADFLYQGTTWHRGVAVGEGGRLLRRISI